MMFGLFFTLLGTAGSLAIYAACAPFRDSPFSDQVLTTERNLNSRALDRLGDIERDGKIRIAMISDIHQNYADFDQVLYAINQTTHIDFVANLGDFTNSGYNLEYDQFVDSYRTFRAPAFTLIGNHDSLGAGPQIFEKVLGPVDFYFESASYRFIFFNSANLENPEQFSPEWLKSTVDASTKPVLIFSHCSLQDPERFTGATALLMNSVLQDSKVKIILNGHNHVYNLASDSSGTALLQIARVQGNSWALLEITGNSLKITQKNNGFETVVPLKP
ncbi:MAG: phosphohydrolase [Proteobacteria bacterium]|nr:MAG: phosphohydrolase [Pseudomonadota bacterium]